MTEEDVIALQTEFEILKKIDHPNVVNMHNMFEDNNHYSLVMELIQGGQVSFLPLKLRKYRAFG